MSSWHRVASFTTVEAIRAHLRRSGIALALDAERAPPGRSPLAQPIEVDGARVGNRFCILPMEGWDGTRDGEPSELTTRRWRNFGRSGAKLIWGGEAVAVRKDGRANPNQLLLTPKTLPSIAALREALVAAHRDQFGANEDRDLFVGLQLTHSGRYSRPHGPPEPFVAYAHPVLDRRFPGGMHLATDEDLDRLADDFVRAARLAWEAGFRFVDVKHCHGYLAHELLGAGPRGGRHGGTLENRTRFLHTVLDGIRAEVPGLQVGVRLSVFDTVPYHSAGPGPGVPEVPPGRYPWGFGILADDDLDKALDDTRAVLRQLRERRVRWVCVTAGSPYYSAHVQRPAIFPPSDSYDPPEDPLRGVARQVRATALLKSEFPEMVFVGSAYSYLQEWLPHVAEHNVREGLTDFVGLGRLALSYPEFPADVLAGRPLRRKMFCRTFSDCTTGPRLGLVSGCFPLDPFYSAHPDAARLPRSRASRQA
jgi:2,4-dienoyl-CoA reductase-like NADH-dependent reductase (Old Yellow Enzyme family)